MNRWSRLAAGAALAVLSFALTGQSPPQGRAAYREAYRTWRTTDASLERDAGAGGSALEGRAQKASAAAMQYTAARKGFLEAWAAAMTSNATQLENAKGAAGAETARAVAVTYRDMVTSQSETIARTIDTFKSDPDPGIQKLRQAMEREQSALAALNEAIDARQKAVTAGATATATLQRAREQGADQYHAIAAALQQVAGETGQQGDALAVYYKKLADSSRGAAAPPRTTPATSAVEGPRESTATPPRASQPSALPLSRYTGAWIYQTGGSFMGAQPEFIDLVVHEDGRKITGTLFARFKLPPGSAGDPVLRFDFSGDFKSARNQTFDLQTSDGAAGTIELIPGSAFNLLEINFRTDPKPGKVRQGNVVLIKK